MSAFRLTFDILLSDLRQAYADACRHKRTKPYVEKFNLDLERNLHTLCLELYERRYVPNPSTCFVISDPKKREVFAADFRDRIVHHLYYNYTHALYERTFIHDSYSCIKGRGIHYGVQRLFDHIRAASRGYTERCYILQMDIKGYFMHIHRQRLQSICLARLEAMRHHKVSKHRAEVWNDVLDMDFVAYLTRLITQIDPTIGCRRKGTMAEWADLPHDKSLFNSPQGCGLPIGNLTSQLFSNIYLNELDQHMKRELHCRHYGRYVDDFYVVSADRQWLMQVAEQVKDYLWRELRLQFHDGKMRIVSAWRGVEFLGMYLKPYRIYVSKTSLGRKARKIKALNGASEQKAFASLNSFCGLMSHGSNYKVRRHLMYNVANFDSLGYFSPDVLKFCCW